MATQTATPATAPVFQDGFESNTLNAWTTKSGFVTQSAVKRSGTFAAQGNTTVGATYAKKLFATTYNAGYARVYFNIVSRTSQVNLLRLRTAADGSIGYLGAIASGKLLWANDIAGASVVSTVTIVSGWHALELHAVVGAAGSTEVWLDGVKVGSLSISGNLGTTPIGKMQIGEVQNGRTYNVVFDDAVFSTGYIGP